MILFSKYHEFLDVFFKKAANELPPYRPYDNYIKLKDHLDEKL